MIEFIAATLIASASNNNSEDINRFCAYTVGIPYGSDDFSDEEWKRFEYCRRTLSQ